VEAFLQSAGDWLCDGYFLDTRYIAATAPSCPEIISASLLVHPLPPHRRDLGFRISGSRFLIGQTQTVSARRASLVDSIERAISGEISVAGEAMRLLPESAFNFYSEMAVRDRWFSELHLQILGARRPQLSSFELASADNELRLASPPFDGLTDACNWLGLTTPGSTANPNTINIRVGPPVDLIFDECWLTADLLKLTLHAHPKFDISRVRLAVRAAPDNGLLGRQQIASKIAWQRSKDGRRPGVVEIALPQSDSALVMLMIESSNVRRQWFIDPAKARNNRYLAVQHFDKELRMVRQAVLESSDSVKFEHGVAALLFLLGFTASVQLETDAPDLVVTTPGGKLTIVECTIRTADIAAKLGKLVDRRGSISKYLAASGHPAEVNAVLVCRSPLDQLPAKALEASQNKVILLTNKDLLAAFDRVRLPGDADEILAGAIARFASQRGLQ
jgi:hypothetical protein